MATAKSRNKAARDRAQADPEAVADAAMHSKAIMDALGKIAFADKPFTREGVELSETAHQAIATRMMLHARQAFGSSASPVTDGERPGSLVLALGLHVDGTAICEYLAKLPAGNGLALLTLVVEGMQHQAEVDRRPDGIMPAFASQQLSVPNIIRPDPKDMPGLGTLAVRQLDPSGEVWQPYLPGLEIDDSGVSAFILAILDAGSAAKSGAGAPLRDRFFAELLMAATTDSRANGERHYLPGLCILDPVAWAGWDPRHYRPDRNDLGLALERGLRDVNTINLPLNDKGGWLIPVFVEAIKSRALDAPIIASVRLPEGSEYGARVDRTVLRRAGKASAIAWRLYLALCFEWNKIANRGRVPHLTRPVMERNVAGYLIDTNGETLTDKRGRPMRHGKHARAVETGQREPSPIGERLHRVYDGPGDLVRSVWPLGAPGQKSHPRRSEEQAVIAARWLAGETWNDTDPCRKVGERISLNRVVLPHRGTRIIRMGRKTLANPDRFPWRIVSPEVK